MRILFRSTCVAMALWSIHATVHGGGKGQAAFVPEDALRMAVYYAAHPREITLEQIQRQTPRKLLLSDCSDYGSLRQCTYMPAETYANEPGLKSVTVSSTTTGEPRGGFILWRFSETPCVSRGTVAHFLGNNIIAPAMPNTFYQPPGTPEATSPSPEYRTYESQAWDPAARVETVMTKGLQMMSLNAHLPKE